MTTLQPLGVGFLGFGLSGMEVDSYLNTNSLFYGRHHILHEQSVTQQFTWNMYDTAAGHVIQVIQIFSSLCGIKPSKMYITYIRMSMCKITFSIWVISKMFILQKTKASEIHSSVFSLNLLMCCHHTLLPVFLLRDITLHNLPYRHKNNIIAKAGLSWVVGLINRSNSLEQWPESWPGI